MAAGWEIGKCRYQSTFDREEIDERDREGVLGLLPPHPQGALELGYKKRSIIHAESLDTARVGQGEALPNLDQLDLKVVQGPDLELKLSHYRKILGYPSKFHLGLQGNVLNLSLGPEQVC